MLRPVSWHQPRSFNIPKVAPSLALHQHRFATVLKLQQIATYSPKAALAVIQKLEQLGFSTTQSANKKQVKTHNMENTVVLKLRQPRSFNISQALQIGTTKLLQYPRSCTAIRKLKHPKVSTNLKFQLSKSWLGYSRLVRLD